MEQALYQAAILTFEELGFVFPVRRDDDEAKINDAQSISSAVAFNGEFSGTLVLQVEREVLPAIASNMLGEDAPFEEAMLRDVLGEITNVICGNTLPEIGGKAAIFQLDAPQITERSSRAENPSATAKLDLEEGRADILLYLN